MALGMSRAVFSFVMEQMSFSLTVSCGISHTLSYRDANETLTLHSELAAEAYQSFPAEDVAIKADPVLREVQSPLQEDVPLESAGVVWSREQPHWDSTSTKYHHFPNISHTFSSFGQLGDLYSAATNVLY